MRQSATMAEGRGEKMIVLLILTIACVGFGVSIPQNNHRRTRRGIGYKMKCFPRLKEVCREFSIGKFKKKFCVTRNVTVCTALD